MKIRLFVPFRVWLLSVNRRIFLVPRPRICVFNVNSVNRFLFQQTTKLFFLFGGNIKKFNAIYMNSVFWVKTFVFFPVSLSKWQNEDMRWFDKQRQSNTHVCLKYQCLNRTQSGCQASDREFRFFFSMNMGEGKFSPVAVHQQGCLQGAESAALMSSHLTGSALWSVMGQNTQWHHQSPVTLIWLILKIWLK